MNQSLKSRRFAAIDIGTVTTRMLIADCDTAGNLTELCKQYRITNLGEGVDKNGYLLPEAIARVEATISDYLVLRDEFECDRTIAVATSASRDASNAASFQETLAKLGITLSVIEGQREASLSFIGASCDFVGRPVVVVDIGGGSTEIIAGIGGQEPECLQSFNIGSRRITERYLHSDIPTQQEIEEARSYIREMIGAYCADLRARGYVYRTGDPLSAAQSIRGTQDTQDTQCTQDTQVTQGSDNAISKQGTTLIAVAGTATSVVSVRDAMEVYDSARVHLAQVSTPELVEVRKRLASVGEAKRRTIVGLDPDRSPVVVAGLLILEEIVEAFGGLGFVAGESDILQGIVLSVAKGEL